MNNSEKFSLSWNDFQANAGQSFQTLREEKDFFAVTLVSEDLQQMAAHKVVLSSSSPVFRQLLRSNKHSHPMLYIRGAKSLELENVLDFIYSGEVSIAQEHLSGFLEIAEELKLKGLSVGEVNPENEKKSEFPEDCSDGTRSINSQADQGSKVLVPVEEVTDSGEKGKNGDLFANSEHNEYSNDDCNPKLEN